MSKFLRVIRRKEGLVEGVISSPVYKQYITLIGRVTQIHASTFWFALFNIFGCLNFQRKHQKTKTTTARILTKWKSVDCELDGGKTRGYCRRNRLEKIVKLISNGVSVFLGVKLYSEKPNANYIEKLLKSSKLNDIDGRKSPSRIRWKSISISTIKHTWCNFYVLWPNKVSMLDIKPKVLVKPGVFDIKIPC